MAILAGDALLALAFEYICRETRGVAPERIVRVSRPCLLLLWHAANGRCTGCCKAQPAHKGQRLAGRR